MEAWDLGRWRVVTASSGSSETGQREHQAAEARALAHDDTEPRARQEPGGGNRGRARARGGARCPAPPPRLARPPLPLQPPHRSREAAPEEEEAQRHGSRMEPNVRFWITERQVRPGPGAAGGGMALGPVESPRGVAGWPG